MSISTPNDSHFDLEKAKTSNLIVRKWEGLTHALMRAWLSEEASNLRRKDIEAEFRKLSKEIQKELIALAKTIQANADKNSTKKPAMFHPGDEINKNHEIKRKKQNQKNDQTPAPAPQKGANKAEGPKQKPKPQWLAIAGAVNDSTIDYSKAPKDALIFQRPEVANNTKHNAEEFLNKMQKGEDILGIKEKLAAVEKAAVEKGNKPTTFTEAKQYATNQKRKLTL